MPYSVSYSSRADQDVADILAWIEERSSQGAARWLDALEEAQARLASDPLRFALAEEADAFDEPTRQILFRTKHGSTYRAVFMVREDAVTIVGVRGPGQRPITKRR